MVVRALTSAEMDQVQAAISVGVSVEADLLASYTRTQQGYLEEFGDLESGAPEGPAPPVLVPVSSPTRDTPEFMAPLRELDIGGGDLPLEFRDLAPGETPYSHPGITHAQHPETHPLGQDYREDFYDENADVDGIGSTLAVGPALVAAGPLLAAARATLRVLMGNARRITAQHWARLPTWAQNALAAVGIGVGVDLALDIPGIPGESILNPFGGGGPPDIFAGGLGVTVVGGWEANGVMFYRLSDGKLAVQNKLGRWKIWKPKKPIVLYASGASNLKTFLKADRALDRQSKKLRKALNRRAPARRSSSARVVDGQVINQVKQ